MAKKMDDKTELVEQDSQKNFFKKTQKMKNITGMRYRKCQAFNI